ncbi:MAG: class I SAM-dependent methyltransferase [Candidatus Obscuribacter sp.]|nr:class I SAM-dependent methyltransferase [Candidatus Obscuribacter sp.]
MTKISMTPTGESGSAYENYNKRHDDYDLTRLPVGVEQVAQYLRDWRNPSELSLLDAGCGTGLHLQYFNQLGLARLIGMDASIIGVAQAAQKFAHLEDDGANPAAEAPTSQSCWLATSAQSRCLTRVSMWCMSALLYITCRTKAKPS